LDTPADGRTRVPPAVRLRQSEEQAFLRWLGESFRELGGLPKQSADAAGFYREAAARCRRLVEE
jgi:hypothetical protein